MKKHLTILLAGLLASAATLTAIPDRFGAFIGATGLRLEDLAFDANVWSSKELAGEWEKQPSTGDSASENSEDVYRIMQALIVFGVKAENVSAVRSHGELSRFLITYRPDEKAGSGIDRLVKTLHANIEACTGTSLSEIAGAGKAGHPGYRGRYKDFEIHLGTRAQNEVLVAIRRVPA